MQSIRIQGDLILSYLKVLGDMSLSNAKIEGSLLLDNSQFLSLNDESLNMHATSITTQSGTDLTNLKSLGPVKFCSSDINGDFICSGAQFLYTGNNFSALDFTSSTLGGNVYLNSDFKSYGQVILLGSTIKGQLICQGGRFLSTKHGITSLNAANITVDSDVYLTDGFEAYGDVLFSGSTIKGTLAIYEIKPRPRMVLILSSCNIGVI